MADGTAAIMAAHGVDRALVMAHSYGTMVAARLVLKYESLVHSLCLMDPVGVLGYVHATPHPQLHVQLAPPTPLNFFRIAAAAAAGRCVLPCS
jgi:pimeloyl-ACP methyl ester carboxylesterase